MTTAKTRKGKTPSKQGRGRPRCEEAHKKILKAAYEMLDEVGFMDLTIEGVAARAEVGKPTIYRRWKTKAQLAMDAFLSAVNPEIAFPDTGSVEEDFREQMNKIVNLMNSSRGEILATVIGSGQVDDNLMAAFRENWLLPRREDAKRIFQRGVEREELRDDVDAEVAIDALYSPLFYRLLLKHLPLSDNFVDELIDVVFKGLAVND
ncbi:transcriptional regulator [Rivularia sp. PCC 7116]|uniref:TetR/AcrR family transcriptional regulator n=1 Tax=Rivularia sp. PCC 7116 TaxID=373994 RepID=UPI00029F1B72|nr:TetR/AcrR family transcriptional regulator [Rivularia sp. PCC 7116]AFY57232.1 transcriptional regulator [Rivularia sp. PCC 7116]